MTNDVFRQLMLNIEAKYRETLTAQKREQYRIPTYEVDDEDADELYKDVTRRCKKMPNAKVWREICADHRADLKIVENTERCWSCGDEGEIFWQQDGCSVVGVCPMCKKGASIKKRNPRHGFCGNDIALAAEHMARSRAAKNERDKKRELSLALILLAEASKERGVKIEL